MNLTSKFLTPKYLTCKSLLEVFLCQIDSFPENCDVITGTVHYMYFSMKQIKLGRHII